MTDCRLRTGKGRLATSRPWASLVALAAFLPVALSGCAPMVVGGAAVGAAAVYDRRPYQIVIDDQRIELAAMHALQQDPKVQGHSRIAVTSYNYSVLLTGQVATNPVAQHATALVSRLPKVRRVIDELTVGPNIDLKRESEDVYLTSRTKLALTKVDLPGFNATRIKVVTEDGVVYLLGLVSPEEANAATEQVRYVPGVKRVVKLFEYQQPAT